MMSFMNYKTAGKNAWDKAGNRVNRGNREDENLNDYDEPLEVDSGSDNPQRQQVHTAHSMYHLATNPDDNDGYEIPFPSSRRTRPLKNHNNPGSSTSLKPVPNYGSQSDDDCTHDRSASLLCKGTEQQNRGRSCSPRWRTLPPLPVANKRDWSSSGYSLASANVTAEPETSHSQPKPIKTGLTRQKVIYPQKGSSGTVAPLPSYPRRERTNPEADSSGHSSQSSPSVHRDVWDNGKQRNKLDEGLNRERAPSVTSEKFEDALEYLPEDWAPAVPKTEPVEKNIGGSQGGSGRSRVQPAAGNYEEAWDLNQGLEKKLRSLGLIQHDSDPAGKGRSMGSGGDGDSYQEPWDTAKKQQELEEQIHRATSRKAGQDQKSSQRSQHERQEQADAYEEAWDMKKGLSHMLKSADGSSALSATPQTRHPVPSSAGKPVGSLSLLQSQEWYHGNITRDDAEKMLMVCKDGSFLVRDSSDRCHYSLSIRSTRQTINIQIDQTRAADGSMTYILGMNSPIFHTIPSMIQYYGQNAIPIKGSEHITLLYPVHRPGSGARNTNL